MPFYPTLHFLFHFEAIALRYCSISLSLRAKATQLEKQSLLKRLFGFVSVNQPTSVGLQNILADML
jgi:hypothetical protein